MKIFRNNKVYIQKNDIAYLTESDESIPDVIYSKLYGGRGVVIIDDSNRYEFMKFTEHEAIDFFSKQDWIIDYDEVKDLTQSEIDELSNEIAEERDAIAIVYNGMTNAEKKKNLFLLKRREELKYKMMALRDFQLFKLGCLKMKLPENIESIASEEKTEPKNKKYMVKKIIKRFFNK